MTLNQVSTFLSVGALLVLALVAFTAVLAIAARFNARSRRVWDDLVASVGPNGLWLAWGMAVIATVGSLYFSEIANLVPCTLCWYQRIAMYPWAIVLGIMAWRREPRAAGYVLPVVGVGIVISGYHYALQRYPNLLPEAACSATVPCSAAYVWKFDLVSIPFMAAVSFAAIITAILVHKAWSDGTSAPDGGRTMDATDLEDSV